MRKNTGYVRIPISMGPRVMGQVTEALGAWEEAGRPDLPPAPGGETAHIGGSLTGDQMRRIIEAGEGCASDGATRLILWMEGR